MESFVEKIIAEGAPLIVLRAVAAWAKEYDGKEFGTTMSELLENPEYGRHADEVWRSLLRGANALARARAGDRWPNPPSIFEEGEMDWRFTPDWSCGGAPTLVLRVVKAGIGPAQVNADRRLTRRPDVLGLFQEAAQAP